MSAVAIRVPQLNVNDDAVQLARWRIASGASVSAGDVICDVETTKAASEIASPTTGILVHGAAEGAQVLVGAVIAAVGDTEPDAAMLVSAPAAVAGSGDEAATSKARALAAQHGLSLDEVRRSGVRGTIKERDVRRLLGAQPEPAAGGVPPWLVAEGPLSAFDTSVAASLRRSTRELILTSVDMECRLVGVHQRLASAKARGVMMSVLHVIIGAAARALPSFPRLTRVVRGGVLYAHRGLDVAFVSRTADGRLFTPVIRQAATLSDEAIAKAAQAATYKIARGSVAAPDLEGAAFTISQVPVPGTSRVVALPSYGQSAILGVSAERTTLEWRDGTVHAVPALTLTLNYDHTLCDGVYAANFLQAVVTDMERLPA